MSFSGRKNYQQVILFNYAAKYQEIFPIRLLNEDVLNGTVLMILVTCTVSSFIVEKKSQQLALNEENADSQSERSDEKDIDLPCVSWNSDRANWFRPDAQTQKQYDTGVCPQHYQRW